MRKFFQAGKFRNLSGAVSLCLGILLVYYWSGNDTVKAKVLAGALQKTAFVAAAFCVTAYNLRVRVIDLLLKISASPREAKAFGDVARNCGRKLTTLVLLYTFTALAMAGFGVLEGVCFWERSARAFACGLFLASISQFVYLVFAFEIVEQKALESMEESADQAARDKLLASKQG